MRRGLSTSPHFLWKVILVGKKGSLVVISAHLVVKIGVLVVKGNFRQKTHPFFIKYGCVFLI